MTEADRQRAFEPFFTTKEIGKGTGLGLSHVYGLAKQSGGTAVIDSRPGRGTTVSIYLPEAAGPAEDETVRAEASGTGLRAAGTAVVLVDDDAEVRETLAELLTAAGCVVTPFASPLAALDRLRAGSVAADLVIVDYAMPKLRGDELAAALRREGIALPVLFITGHADPEALRNEAWVLRKPFRAGALIEMTQRMLQQHPV